MAKTRCSFDHAAQAAFRAFIERAEFPCLGAKAALNAGTLVVRSYGELGGEADTATLGKDLRSFGGSESLSAAPYTSFAAIFRHPLDQTEVKFEADLWRQLRQLHQLDESEYDPAVASDPADPRFSFSFAGRAYYVIGLHANSSRQARQFHWPALVFNPHEQFERLRSDGKWRRMQATIRARDCALQGSSNPMLSDFGERSEARQYSGRAVPDEWQPPFEATNSPNLARCPFHS